MNKNINTGVIKMDLERDKTTKKQCESCETYESDFLYVVQNGTVTGIFHICKLCSCKLTDEVPHLLVPKCQ